MADIHSIIKDMAVTIRQQSERIRRLEKLVTRKRAVACRVYNSVDFTHNSTGNFLPITFDTDRLDANDMHSTSTNTDRITVPSDGWYHIWGNAVFYPNATGARVLEIRVGGSTVIGRSRMNTSSGSVSESIIVSSLYYLNKDNYVGLYAYQNSGGNLAVIAAGNYSPEFGVILLQDRQ